MATIASTEAQPIFGEIIDEKPCGELVCRERCGRPLVVIVDVTRFQ